MGTLERALTLAAVAHAGQTDKAEQPYILHPIRVMLNVRTEDERMAALLHAVVEDTDTTFEDLRRDGFSEVILEAVRALTKHEGESREAAAGRAVANPIARNVKLADVTDNLNLCRIPNPTEADLERLEEYKRVKGILLAAPVHRERKILFLDMDNVLVDFASAIPRLTRRERERYAGHLDDVAP